MRLIVGGSFVLNQPDDNAVHAAIRSLLEKSGGDDAFAILINGQDPDDSEYYLQTLFCPPDPLWKYDTYRFLLEYREGSSDRHYQCFTVPHGLQGLEEVTKAFIDYLHGNIAWQTYFEWERGPGL